MDSSAGSASPPTPSPSDAPARPSRAARAWAWAKPRAHLALPISAFLTVVVSTWHIWPGAVQTGDAFYHLANAHDVAFAVRHHQDPLGRLPQVFGTPVFRFYQSLLALSVGSLQAWTDLPLEFLYSIFVIVPFMLSPFAYHYFLRSLGLRPWTSAIGSYLSITTVFGFSNSFIGNFSGGIATQAMASLFFPLFMGRFVRQLRGESRVIETGVFHALTTVAHAAFAVYAILSAAVATIVLWPKDLASVRRIVAAGLVAGVLASYWLVPFLSYQREHRSLPDVVMPAGREHWFTGLSAEDIGALIATGRFFDGERDERRGPGDELDAKMMAFNIFGITKTFRPPIFTLLLALGLLCTLIRIREPSSRYLLSGLGLSMLLILGQDEVPLLGRLPLLKQMQGFRATYLVDQAAFGIAAIGIHDVVAIAIRFGRRLPRLGVRALATVGTVAATAAVGVVSSWLYVHAEAITTLPPATGGWPQTFESNLERFRRRIGPYRVRAEYKAGTNVNRKNNLLHRLGWTPPCSHVGGVVGWTSRMPCSHFGAPPRGLELAELLGVGYHLIDPRTKVRIADVHLPDGSPRFHKLRARRGLELWESVTRAYVHSTPGPVVLVLANDEQWVLGVQSWLGRFAARVTDPDVPMPVRASADDLADGRFLARAAAVAILDPSLMDGAPPALRHFPGPVVSTARVAGIRPEILGAERSPWEALSGLAAEPPRDPAEKWTLGTSRSFGRDFRFRATLEQPALALLAETCFRNWTATVDGRPVAVRPAGPDLVSAFVPAGEHRVEFRWVTTPLEIACDVASLTGWSAVFALGAVVGVRRVRRLRRRA